jgi:predicted MFS family arabinose efflux permease
MAEPAPEPLSHPTGPAALHPAYPWFVAGVASWFGAWGLQQVMFSWLVVGVLEAPAEWVGVTQTSSMLPAIFLLLLGGAVADRLDPRRLLIGLHLLAVLPVMVLAALVAAERLNIALLIAYGLSMGTVMAFSNPARDSLLSRVAGDDVMRAVTGATIAQFASQGLGALLGGAARWTGIPAMLLLQAAALGLGGAATRRVPAMAPAPRHARGGWHELTEGLRFVLGTPLRLALLLACGVGVFFMGPFLVVFPLMVRDVYAGDVRQLSVVLMLFPLGTIVGSAVLLLRGGIRRKGASLLVALALGGLALVILGRGLSFAGFLLVTLLWGLAGSVFMNANRTLFQEAAPPALRARVLAVSQLGFMATAPMGSLLAGFVSGRIGPLATLTWFGCGMLALVAAVTFVSDMRRME